MNPWILLAVSICLEIVATNLLKVSDGFNPCRRLVLWLFMAVRSILLPLFFVRFPLVWCMPFGLAWALC